MLLELVCASADTVNHSDSAVAGVAAQHHTCQHCHIRHADLQPPADVKDSCELGAREKPSGQSTCSRTALARIPSHDLSSTSAKSRKSAMMSGFIAGSISTVKNPDGL